MKKKEHIDGDGRVIRRLAAAMGLLLAASAYAGILPVRFTCTIWR